MKITSVDVIRFNSGRAPVKGSLWHPTVVRVNTDEGISGLGEIGLAYCDSRNGAFGIAQDLARLILGMDPMNGEQIWEKLYRGSFWAMGGGGFVFGGISAIDIALWDIRGKALNMPVYQLLGGKTNPKLRAYASQIQLDWGTECKPLLKPGEYAEATIKAMDDGYTCVKVNPAFFGPDGAYMQMKYTGMLEYEHLRIAVDRVAAIREAGGDGLDIIIELHALTDANTAVQLGRELERFRCMFIEEATGPLNVENTKYIAQNVKIPLAGGERIYGRWGFRPFLENQSLRLIQPDLGNCGGITEGKKICDMANTYDVAVQAHICGGPVAIAAALQLEAVIPNFLIHEHHAAALMLENKNLCKYDYQPRDGYFEIPDLPGIGQELNDDALKMADIVTVSSV